MINVLELKGYKAWRAFNAFHTLMLGLKMLPIYVAESYETFYKRFAEKPEDEKEKDIRQAALFVELSKEEIESVIGFVADSNGIPYQPANLKNLTPDMIHEIIVAVCLEIGRIKIDLVSNDEKKK